MDRQILSSTRAAGDTSRYAVGILDQNELHITPLEGVLSLRPSMEYLDQSDRTAKGKQIFLHSLKFAKGLDGPPPLGI